MEYVRSVHGSSARYPQPLENPGFAPIEESRRESLGHSPLRRSIGSPYPEAHLGRNSYDGRISGSNDDVHRTRRRQSLQLGSDRRTSLTAEVDNGARRTSLPEPISQDFKPQKKRVVGNGVYKFETLPWYESSLRQAMARRAYERKEQLASPLPLINLRPEAEARLRGLLGEEDYAEWRRKHRASYLLNDG